MLNFYLAYATNIIINDVNEPKFTVLLNDWNNSKVNISIFTEDYELAYRDVLDAAASDYIVYNIQTLESGKYIIVLENEVKKSKEVLSLTAESLQKVSEEMHYKPHVAISDTRIYINYLALGQYMKIELLNGGKELYSETINGESAIGRIINVEQLLTGNYTLRLGNNEIYEVFHFSKK